MVTLVCYWIARAGLQGEPILAQDFSGKIMPKWWADESASFFPAFLQLGLPLVLVQGFLPTFAHASNGKGWRQLTAPEPGLQLSSACREPRAMEVSFMPCSCDPRKGKRAVFRLTISAANQRGKWPGKTTEIQGESGFSEIGVCLHSYGGKYDGQQRVVSGKKRRGFQRQA